MDKAITEEFILLTQIVRAAPFAEHDLLHPRLTKAEIFE